MSLKSLALRRAVCAGGEHLTRRGMVLRLVTEATVADGQMKGRTINVRCSSSAAARDIERRFHFWRELLGTAPAELVMRRAVLEADAAIVTARRRQRGRRMRRDR